MITGETTRGLGLSLCALILVGVTACTDGNPASLQPAASAPATDVAAAEVGDAAAPAQRVRVNRLPSVRPDQTSEICAVPSAVAVAAGSVWVACWEDELVIRFDTSSGEQQTVVRVRAAKDRARAEVGSLAALDGRVWVGDEDGRRVLGIDPRTDKIVQSQKFDTDIGGVFNASGVLWAAGWPTVGKREHPLFRLHPRTAEVESAVVFDDDVQAVAATADATWVAVFNRGIDRIDQDGAVSRVVDDGYDVAAVDGRVWAAAGDLVAIDAATSDIAGRWRLPGLVKRVLIARRHLWVVTEGNPPHGQDRLFVLDSSTGDGVARVKLPGTPVVSGLATDGRHVWAADEYQGRLYRLAAPE